MRKVSIEYEVFSFAELKELRDAAKAKLEGIPRAERKPEDTAEEKRATAGFEKALQTLGEWATSDKWYEYAHESWIERLHLIGFEDAEISFSGFWSQGDGASFTAKRVNIRRLCHAMRGYEALKSLIEASQDDHLKELMHSHEGTAFEKILKESPGQTSGVSTDDWGDDSRDWYVEGFVKRNSSRYSHENTCSFEYDVCGSYQDDDKATNTRLNELEKDIEALRKSLCHDIYNGLEEEYEHLTSEESCLEQAEANEYEFEKDGSVFKG